MKLFKLTLILKLSNQENMTFKSDNRMLENMKITFKQC